MTKDEREELIDAGPGSPLAAKTQGRLKEYFNRTVLGPKLLVVDEIGYLPFGP